MRSGAAPAFSFLAGNSAGAKTRRRGCRRRTARRCCASRSATNVGPAACGGVPLGWIVSDDPTTPEQEIYLSYENTLTLLDNSDGVVGPTRAMPRAAARDHAGAGDGTRARARARALPAGVEDSHRQGPDDGGAFGGRDSSASSASSSRSAPDQQQPDGRPLYIYLHGLAGLIRATIARKL